MVVLLLLILVLVPRELVLHALQDCEYNQYKHACQKTTETTRTTDAAVFNAGAHGGSVCPACGRRSRPRDGLRNDGGGSRDLRVGAKLKQDVALLVEDGVGESEGGGAREDAGVSTLEVLE